MVRRVEPSPNPTSLAVQHGVVGQAHAPFDRQALTAGLEAPKHPLSTVLLCVLLSLIFYLPNYAQLRIDTGIRGLNVVNVLFIVSLFILWVMPKGRSEAPPLRLPIFLFFGLLSWALAVALIGDSSAWVEDVTDYKNAIFYILLYFLFYYAVRDMRTVRLMVLMIVFVMFTSSFLGVRQPFD